MSEHQTVPVPSPITDPVPNMLPAIFRVTSLARLPLPEGRKGVYNVAELFHEQACLRVGWMSPNTDTRLQKGSLVSVRWSGNPVSVDGAIRINRLVVLERPEPALNLFDTLPHGWVKERSLVTQARDLWESLGRPFQHLVNAIFWDSARFHRFIAGPSSLNGHHNEVNGNFRHTLEVARRCASLALGEDCVCVPVLLTAALLHDAGKADEYRMNPKRQKLEMSPRGMLIGHRHTILEWVAVAREKHRVILPEAHYIGLIHVLTAAKGAEWLGIRNPLSVEAPILSAADRLSGHVELVSAARPDASGFGAYHPHLKGRPFVLPSLG